MKKTFVPAMIVLILALIAAIGSQSFLGPCVHEDGSFGACHWAGRALLGVGGLLAALALLALLPRCREGLCLAMALTSALGLLVPGPLVSLCGMSTMRCQALMRPAMSVLFALTLAASALGWLLEHRKAR